MQLRTDDGALTREAQLLEAIAAATDGGPGPVPLSPDAYARTHALFERRSDQRALITATLQERLARRRGPLSVLSVGCGDGSVDVPLARALTSLDPTRRVRYVGVEPHPGSAALFGSRMEALGHSGVDAEVHVSTFDDATPAGTYDVITFVHSLYYVPDLAASLDRAASLLRPGGELLLLIAPRGALNRLTTVLAPPLDGHHQWFSEDVATACALATTTPDLAEVRPLDARLDLTDADDDVLDFTVQAVLDDAVRPLVRDYLEAIAQPGAGLAVAHPVDLYRLTAGD